MHSPTSLEDSRLIRIVVPCAQTRLPGPRGHRDAFSSSSERRKHCGDPADQYKIISNL